MNQEARRGATVAAAAVLTFVALLVPQITGALSLTTLGKLLTIAGVALLTATGQRLGRCVRDRQIVKAALRVWPAEPLRTARLETLGVFPAHDAQGRSVGYQARPAGEDETLAEALRMSRNVIVHGPPRCGKSRAAGQAARTALADVPVVIPRDAQSLRALLDGGIQPADSQPQVCLWLDGLDRFMEVLDQPSLADLRGASKPAVRIVGTVRSEQWTELVGGSGQSTEAARALAQNARVVELGPFSPRLPGESSHEPPRAPAKRPRASWQDGLLGLFACGLLAIVLAGAIFNADLLTPPSIAEQMNEIKSQILAQAGPGGGNVVVDERVWFHPADEPSWLLVVEDLPSHAEFYRGAANGGHPQPRSDDLRIYDDVDGQLRLELHFRPRGIGKRAAEWRILEAGAAPSGDYDEDGAPEVIAGYAVPSEATEALLPFGIDWEDDHYELVSLTPETPKLETYGLDARTLRYRREAYEKPLTLRTAVSEPRFSGLELKGYRVQAFALTQKPAPRLLTGYFSAFPEYGKSKVLEIHANQFRAGELEILPCVSGYYACPAPKAAQDAVIPPDMTPDYGLLEAWETVSGRWTTHVRVVQRPSEPASAAATKPAAPGSSARGRAAPARAPRRSGGPRSGAGARRA